MWTLKPDRVVEKETSMDDEIPSRPRKQRSKPGTGRQTRKQRSVPWYRHLSILITTGVCIVFAVLIAGTVVVRNISQL
ncbi:MAG TPA: hypothetical protein VGM98_24015 [Schlesneria sp.]|jgi:hypothetical protein